MKKILVLGLLLNSIATYAEDDLTKKLDDLRIPDDKVTPLISQDKLYLVNTRYSSLTNRHELTLSGANNFTAESHLDTKQAGASYRYHINPKWSLGIKYNTYTNELTQAGKDLFNKEKLLPDTDYALKSTYGFASFNTIYGKLRWSPQTVVYFDQYIALGYGDVDLARGAQKMINLDLGFSFWLGKHMSTRIGVNNE
jgi:outer membrane beta-barrel protein